MKIRYFADNELNTKSIFHLSKPLCNIRLDCVEMDSNGETDQTDFVIWMLFKAFDEKAASHTYMVSF